MAPNKKIVKVWDPLVRIGHWTLVVAFFTAYLTEDDFMTLHVWAGYIVGAYVLIRIPWGFIGGKYARFCNFVYSPAKIVGYMKKLLTRQPQHYIGHNPAGGVMVVALLVSLAGTTWTGLKLYAAKENKGPFALNSIPFHIQFTGSISEANAEKHVDDNEREEAEFIADDSETDEQEVAFLEEVHELLANLTLMLVMLHIAGIIASSYDDKEKLVKAMLTGEKETDDTYQ